MLRPITPYVRAFTASGRDVILDELTVAISGQKSINDWAGAFAVEILPQAKSGFSPTNTFMVREFYKAISPGDIISLGMESPHDLMLGIVDKVYKRKVTGEKTTTSLVIQGRDFGKILLEDNIVYAPLVFDENRNRFIDALQQLYGNKHPILRGYIPLWGPGDRFPKRQFEEVTINEAIDFVIENAITLQVQLPKGYQSAIIPEVTARSAVPGHSPADLVYMAGGPATYDGTIANFLNRILDKPFYEGWVDTKTRGSGSSIIPVPYIRVRPTPFDEFELNNFAREKFFFDDRFSWDSTKTWVDEKPYHEITEDDILEKALGVTDLEVKSFYTVTLEREVVGTAVQELKGLSFPILDVWAAKKYGMRALREKSLHVNDRSPIASTPELVRRKRNQMFNWFRMNPDFESGRIRIPGKDKIKIGDRVALMEEIGRDDSGGPKDPMVFYLPSLSFSWKSGSPGQVNEMYSMILNLTRGHTKGMVKTFMEKVKTDPAFVIYETATPVGGVPNFASPLSISRGFDVKYVDFLDI